jgi:hypothetical protein
MWQDQIIFDAIRPGKVRYVLVWSDLTGSDTIWRDPIVINGSYSLPKALLNERRILIVNDVAQDEFGQ